MEDRDETPKEPFTYSTQDLHVVVPGSHLPTLTGRNDIDDAMDFDAPPPSSDGGDTPESGEFKLKKGTQKPYRSTTASRAPKKGRTKSGVSAPKRARSQPNRNPAERKTGKSSKVDASKRKSKITNRKTQATKKQSVKAVAPVVNANAQEDLQDAPQQDQVIACYCGGTDVEQSPVECDQCHVCMHVPCAG